MLIEPKRHIGVAVGIATGAVLCWLILGAADGGDERELVLRGFPIEKEVSVPLDPGAAFDAFTGDISSWWDHHFSERPVRLVIEPRAGCNFLESFDDAGAGVIHGLVTWSERGKNLVIRGWPGPFHSAAGIIVHTVAFVPADSGTKIKATIRMAGEFDAQSAAVVDRVWNHFLVKRYKPYAEKLSKP